MTGRVQTRSTIFGLIVVGLGVLFLLETTGAVDHVFSDWWPVLLMVWGVRSTVQDRGHRIFGPVVFLLGLGFLLRNLDVLGEGWLGRWWPIEIIVAGVVIVAGALRVRSGSAGRGGASTAGEEWLDATAVMSRRTEAVTSRAWRGGRAGAVLGEMDVDLRDAQAAADGAVLRVTAFMGTVQVIVSPTWEVSVRGHPILGGFDDRSRRAIPGEGSGRSRLKITGTAMLGTVEVTN